MTSDMEPSELPAAQARAMYDSLTRKAARAGTMRRIRVALLGLTVVLGSTAAFYGLTTVFSSHRSVAPRSVALGGAQTGDLIVVQNRPNDGVYSVAPDGSKQAQVYSDNRSDDVAPSPDGTRLALVGGGGILVMNADGANVRQLTNDRSDTSPTWSSDSREIAFAREDGSGGADIFVVPSDGGQATQLTKDVLIQSQPAWSPNGKQIAFVAFERDPQGFPSASKLYVMNSDGGTAQVLGGHEVAQPAWSPDGSRIVFVNDGGIQGGSLATIASGDGAIRTLYQTTAGVILSPCWSPSGTDIAFISGSDVTNLQVYEIASDGTGPITQITHGDGSVQDVAWSS